MCIERYRQKLESMLTSINDSPRTYTIEICLSEHCAIDVSTYYVGNTPQRDVYKAVIRDGKRVPVGEHTGSYASMMAFLIEELSGVSDAQLQLNHIFD